METTTTNNSPESNNTSGGNSTNNLPKFLKDFCSKEVSNSSNKNEILDSIFDKSEIPKDLVKNMLEWDNENKKYEWVKLEDIKIWDLKNKLAGDFVTLKHKRSELENNINEQYDLSTKEKKTLKSEINNLDYSKLNETINSDKQRNDFTKWLFWNKVSNISENNFPNLWTISNTEYQKRLSKLNTESEKQQIKTIFEEASNWKITEVNLKILIEKDFLTSSQKKEIVWINIPVISLSQAENLGFLTKQEVKDKKKKILEQYLNDIDWLDSDKKDEIFDSINPDDIKISTKSFLNDKNVLILSEKIWFKQFENDLNNVKDEVNKISENEWPQSFSDLKSKLKELNVWWIENLKEKSVLKFSIIWENKNYTEEYLRLDNNYNETSTLWFSLIWSKKSKEWKISINKKSTEKRNYKYFEILKLFDEKFTKWNKISLEIYDDKEFDKKIEDKEKFNILETSLDTLKKDEFEEKINKNPEYKNQLVINLSEKYSNELDELKKQLLELEDEKKKIKNSNVVDNKKLELFDVKIKKLELLIRDKNNDIEIIINDPDIDMLLSYNNFNDLLEKLDWIDFEWKKLWLKKWIIIESTSWNSKWQLFEITWLNDGIEWLNNDEKIELKSFNWKKELISYEDFFQAFKTNKAKRIEKINNFDEILIDNWWAEKDFELKGDNLVQKWVEFNWKKEDKSIDYLVSEKWKLIKIESIWNWEVEVIFWKLSEWKENKDTKKTINKLTLDSTSVKLSLSELNKIIKDDKFTPDWKVWANYTIDNIDWFKNDIKPSLWTRYLNRATIMELVMSWKMLIDGIEDYMKRWNDVKAAELALKMAKFLPEEMSADFTTQTEMKSAEAMEKELTALWKIASGDATKRILWWLKNKNTPEYKKEAWLLFVSKYWLLYPKKLADYNWSFLWYEALWWKIWDNKYEEEKLKAEKAWLPFDEKELLIYFLWAQSLWHHHIKRRSKFYKEFKWKIAGGFTEENDTWYKDAKDKRNIWDMNNWWFSEIEGNTVPNSLWWAKRAVEKWGSLKEMNEIYFTLIFSWALSNAWSKTLEELKEHWTRDWNWMIMALFCSDWGAQKIFNKTVVSISKEIEKVEWSKYSWIAKEAKEIFDSANDIGSDFTKKAKRTRAFWNEYWEVLSRTLYMTDDDNTNFAKTDKIIAFWKDNEYKEYFKVVKTWTKLSTAFKKEYMEDDVWQSWVTWLDNFEVIRKYYKVDTSRTFRSDSIKVIDLTWPKIWWDIKSVKDKIENGWGNKNQYRKYLNNKLREISAWLLSWAWKEYVSTLDVIDPAWLDLASIWITLSDFKSNRVDEVLNGDAWSEIFNNAVENVISWNFWEKNELWNSSIFWTIDSTKEAANDTIIELQHKKISFLG